MSDLALARLEYDDDRAMRDESDSEVEAFCWIAAWLGHEGRSVAAPEIWIRSWRHILRRERQLEIDLELPLVDLGGEG